MSPSSPLSRRSRSSTGSRASSELTRPHLSSERDTPQTVDRAGRPSKTSPARRIEKILRKCLTCRFLRPMAHVMHNSPRRSGSTRRPLRLVAVVATAVATCSLPIAPAMAAPDVPTGPTPVPVSVFNYPGLHQDGDGLDCGSSEEHTSELQSLLRISSAVFCL